MNILNSTIEDIDEIFSLYKIATDYQQNKPTVVWPEFDRSLVETEILENRQWKMMIDGTVACIWAITFSDPEIWEEWDNNSSIYIHRIATANGFRGKMLVADIVRWAKEYALQTGRKFIRLDTVGENKKLITHYTKCGFDYLGMIKLKNTAGLPIHYHNAEVSLFELEIK